MMKKFTSLGMLLTAVFLLSFHLSPGQTVGDYRSKTTGNWTATSTWEYYDGSSWVTATQFPGQTDGSYEVTISLGNEVSINAAAAPPADNTYAFGDLNVVGKLSLNANLSLLTTLNFYIDGSVGGMVLMKVHPLDLYLPDNSAIYINPGAADEVWGLQAYSCDNNQNIWIGAVRYAACHGIGQTFAGDFADVNGAGGSLHALPVAEPNPKVCTGGTVTIKGGPPGMDSYQWTVPVGGGFTGSYTTNTQNLGTLTFPTDGMYNFMLKITKTIKKITFVNSETLTINVGQSKVWNGTKWSGDGLSPFNEKVIFQGNYHTSLGNITACTCTVDAGNTVIVSPNTFIDVKDHIVNNGSITVESDGNLIQRNDAGTFTGNPITAKRTITFKSNARDQYNFLISPVIGQNLKTIYPGLPTTPTYPYVLYHNEATNFFVNSTGAYIAGRGLAVKEPSASDIPSVSVNAEFRGAPANGVITIPLGFTNNILYGYNLVGNPYPSNIDLQKFYVLNGGSISPAPAANGTISSTFYFWDNGANNNAPQQGSSYDGRAYAVYNAYSDTGNKAGYLLTPPQIIGTKLPNKIVKTGQGFMVRATGSGTSLLFNNSIRISDQAGAGFFSKAAKTPVNRYWLKLTTPNKLENTIAVVYFEGGSADFGIDDSEMNADYSDMFYSMAGSHKLQIEGRPAFKANDRIFLGSSSAIAGKYTLSLGEREGIFANGQSIYLKDIQTGILTNLSAGNYTFTANLGETNGRFEIIYTPETVLSTHAAVKDGLVVYRDGSNFVIKSTSKKITELTVYDAGGRLVDHLRPDSNLAVISSEHLAGGFYLLKIDQSGFITIKKLIK